MQGSALSKINNFCETKIGTYIDDIIMHVLLSDKLYVITTNDRPNLLTNILTTHYFFTESILGVCS